MKLKNNIFLMIKNGIILHMFIISYKIKCQRTPSKLALLQRQPNSNLDS